MPIKIRDISVLQTFPFKITQYKLTYLGIEVTKYLYSLFKANFPPLVTKLLNNIQFWRSLPIYLIGRVNIIKMIFFPEILYLFQNIPIFLPKIKSKLDSMIIPFLWDYKAHRISKAHLCKPKAGGGMALPNVVIYYYACVLQTIIIWLDHTVALSTWIQMKREACRPYDIGAVILSPIKIDTSVYNHNCIIHITICIWKQIKSKILIKPLSFLLPISWNPSFTPSTMDATFTKWRDLGLNEAAPAGLDYIQRTGMTIAEAWFCTQWPSDFCVVFLRFVFVLLYGWKIQT